MWFTDLPALTNCHYTFIRGTIDMIAVGHVLYKNKMSNTGNINCSAGVISYKGDIWPRFCEILQQFSSGLFVFYLFITCICFYHFRTLFLTVNKVTCRLASIAKILFLEMQSSVQLNFNWVVAEISNTDLLYGQKDSSCVTCTARLLGSCQGKY